MADIAQRKAHLSMTADDHGAIGSTPPRALTDNPGRQLHETMDDNALRHFIAEQLMFVTAEHQQALSGNPQAMQLFTLHLEHYLAPNIAYLKEIGRIPDELEEFDPATAFPLNSGGATITLPGNSTKSDLIEIIKMAVSIARNPEAFTASQRLGCAVALEIFLSGVN